MNTWQKITTEDKKEKIYKTFMFPDFYKATAFVMKVYLLAERLNHHPEIHHDYSSVTIYCTTHDSGNRVTEKDLKLAEKIDGLLQ